MIRLLLADLRHHGGSWAWTLAIAVVAASCIAGQFRVVHGALALARSTGDADIIESANVISGLLITGVVLSATAVLSSTSGLAVSQREREHGLWKALGMSPSTVRGLILGQLLALGLLASLVSVPLSIPLGRLLLDQLVSDGVFPPTSSLRWEAADLIWTALISAGTLVLGGRSAARRAACAPEAVLLRGTGGGGAPGRDTGRIVLRILGVVIAAAGWVAGLVVITVSDDGEAGIQAVFNGSLSALVLLCLLCAWITPLLERMVAALVPGRGVAWHVAGRTCALESRRSSATVLPFVVAIGLVAIVLGVAAGLPGASSSAFFSLFGLPFLVAWTGGVAVIAMSAGQRQRDAALLRAAGAEERDVLLMEVLEGVIHAVAACLIGLLVALAAAVLMARLLNRSVVEMLMGFANGPTAIVCGATLLTTCLAVVASSRVSALVGRQSPAQVLRARE
ncbi:FtsX-like permease family protein [Actinomyces capricornis]|uniref:ABC3 transporter permease C-terminal domain-containing protein n=1 Tax=Actinomyces capricornis TaxID=2755559 RepID=A0ABM7UKF4_9ACTO|nr:FtsX-like permease family protein [Actinomyces capricornis]BDA64405.1 hypothetical protein MANAM107_12390 [Actinomyces capricornis]